MKSSMDSRSAPAETREYHTHIWLKPWLVAADDEIGVMPAERSLSIAASNSARLVGSSVMPACANNSLL